MPATDLHIALLPLDMKLGENRYNIQQVEEKLTNLRPSTDIVVLPEMCSTGYTTDADMVEAMAEPADNPTSLVALQKLSSDRKVAICGSIVVKDGNRYFNRGFFINPDSPETVFYDKRHLFSMGGENLLYTQGSSLPPIFSFRGWNISMSICYDLRFPVWMRNVGCGYDVMLIPANWPSSRGYAWRQLLIARAIENQCYVAGCDRTGNDFYGSYTPQLSIVVNPRGEEISSTDESGLIYAILNGQRLERDREKFPVWKDADSFDLSV